MCTGLHIIIIIWTFRRSQISHTHTHVTSSTTTEVPNYYVFLHTLLIQLVLLQASAAWQDTAKKVVLNIYPRHMSGFTRPTRSSQSFKGLKVKWCVCEREIRIKREGEGDREPTGQPARVGRVFQLATFI